MAQFQITRLPLTEFKALGFRILTPSGEEPPMSPGEVEKKTAFLIKDSALATDFEFSDYPKECKESTPEHEAWIEAASK